MGERENTKVPWETNLEDTQHGRFQIEK